MGAITRINFTRPAFAYRHHVALSTLLSCHLILYAGGFYL